VDLAANVMSLMDLTLAREHARMSYITATTHNLRTPLCGLDLCLGYLRQSLKSSADYDTFLDSLDQAQANVDVMKWTVEKAIVSAKQHYLVAPHVPDIGTVSISKVIERIQNAIKPIPKSVPIYFQITQDCPDIITTSENVLWHSLMDMLTNACQFTSTGSITVVFSASLSKDTIRVEVIDTGNGVTVEVKDKLFIQPFVTEGSSKTGFGLGCFNIQNNVGLLNGKCGCKKNIPEGSIFWIEFSNVSNVETPRDYSPAMHTLKQNPSQNECVTNMKGDQYRVLVIDDCLTIRKMTQRCLQKIGFINTDIAENGKVGVEMMKKTEYSIVFCDFLMPIMNGLECVKLYREWEKSARQTQSIIIGISANAEKEDIEFGNDLGMNYFYQKPISFQTLKDFVDNVLKIKF